MAQLTCSGLVLGYEGHIVLSGLDFSVDAGDYLCIVGAPTERPKAIVQI